jgi:hypothetical protein
MMVADTLAKLQDDNKSQRHLDIGRSKKAFDYEGIARANQTAIHKMAVYYSCQRLCQTITFFLASVAGLAAPVGVPAIGKLARGLIEKPGIRVATIRGLWQPGRSEG